MNTLWNSVTKLSQILAIVLGLCIFALGFYLGQQSNKVVESEIEGALYNAQIDELENQYVGKITTLKEYADAPTEYPETSSESTGTIAVSASNTTSVAVTIIGENQTNPAELVATVVHGTVTEIHIISGGSGYTQKPTLEIPGLGILGADITLLSSEDADLDGSIESVTLK